MPENSSILRSRLATPSPPSRQIVPVQRVKVTKGAKKTSGVDSMACTHDYQPLPNYTDDDGNVVLNSSICQTCHRPDFRRLKCKHCERPQSDTGTCRCD